MKKIPVPRFRSIENWIFQTLAYLLLNEKSTFLEINCTTDNISKWIVIRKIKNFIGLCPNEKMKQDVKDKWKAKKGEGMPTLLVEKIMNFDPENIRFHGICCFKHQDMFFESAERCRELLKKVYSLLKSGGYFFTTLVDTSELWLTCKKYETNEIHGETFTFSVLNKFSNFGTQVHLEIRNEKKNGSKFIVRMEDVIKIAHKIGFEFVSGDNFAEFYRENRKHFQKDLEAYQIRTSIPQSEMELVELFCVLILRKPHRK